MEIIKNSFCLLFLFANVLNVISAEAGDDWVKQLYFSNKSKGYGFAEKKCKQKDMRLVVLDTEEKNEAIKKYLLQQNNEQQYWIGARRKGLDGGYSLRNAFRWVTGGRLNIHKYFAPDRPNNNVENIMMNMRHYLSIKMRGDQLLWWDSPSGKSFPYICEPNTVKTEPPIPEPENIYGFTFRNYMTKYIDYILKSCTNRNNEEPLFIDSKEKQDAFTKLKKENDDRLPYPLAIRRTDNNSPYTYFFNPNITLNYTNWANGQPSKNDKELCAVVIYDPKTDEAKWRSRNCDKYEFIACQKKEEDKTTEAATTEAAATEAATTQAATTEASTAEDDWLKQLYFSNESKGIYFTNKDCKEKDMRLVVLDTEKKNEAIKNYLLQQKNEHQFWIGARREALNGEFAISNAFRWVTGGILNIHKYFGPDRPNNNVKNFVMDMRYYLTIKMKGDQLLWWDAATSGKYFFICEPTTVKTEPPIPEPENKYGFTFTNFRTKNTEVALKYCLNVDKSKPLFIDSQEKQDAYTKFRKESDDRIPYPLAIQRADNKSPYTYFFNPNITLNYTNWAKGQPSKNGKELCAVVVYDPKTDDAKWRSHNCYQYNFIPCQKKEGYTAAETTEAATTEAATAEAATTEAATTEAATTEAATTEAATTEAATTEAATTEAATTKAATTEAATTEAAKSEAATTEGSTAEDDWVKQLYFSNESKAIYPTNRECKQRDMRLVVLDTVDKNEVIKKYLLQQKNEHQFWTGGKREDANGEYGISNSFRWVTGGRLNIHKYFAPDRPNNNVKNLVMNMRYYLTIKMRGDQLLWWDSPSSAEFFFICEPKTVKTEPPIPEPENKYGFTFTPYMTKTVESAFKGCKDEDHNEPLFIDSKEKQDAFTKLKKENDDRIPYPLAIRRANRNSPYTQFFNTNITLDYTNWAKGHPTKNGLELCAVIAYDPKTDEAKWRSKSCKDYEFTACQKKEGYTAAATTEAATTAAAISEAATTAAATTAAAITEAAATEAATTAAAISEAATKAATTAAPTTETSTDEDEWVKKLYFSNKTVIFRDFGQKDCESKKMRMVVLDTEEKNEAVRKYMEKNGINMQFWIGCRRMHDGKTSINDEFRWETGSRLNIYKYFAEDRPNNYQGNSLSRSRINISIRRDKEGKLVWYDEESSSNKSYICEATTVKTEPPIPEPENRYNFTFSSYQVKAIRNVFKKCERQNQQVLFIDSKEKAEAFKNLKKANDDRLRYLIAVSRVDENSDYTYYNTNKKIDYANWADGQPSKKSNELCAEVQYDPRSDDVKWNSVDCEGHHFVPCENKEKVSKVPTSNPCSGGINGNVNAQAGGVGANGNAEINCNLAIQGGISGTAGGQAGFGGAGKGGISGSSEKQAGVGGAGKGEISGSSGGQSGIGGAEKGGISGGDEGKGSIGGKEGISGSAGGQAGIGGSGKGGIGESAGEKGGVGAAGKEGISGSDGGKGSIGGKGGVSASAGGKLGIGGAGKGGISGSVGVGSIGGSGKGGIGESAGGKGGVGAAGKEGISESDGGKGSIGGKGGVDASAGEKLGIGGAGKGGISGSVGVGSIGGSGKGGIGESAGEKGGVGAAEKEGISGSDEGKLGIGGAGKGEISGSNGRKEGIGETGKGGIGGSAGGQSGTSAAGKGGKNESGAGKGGISGSNGGKESIGGKGGVSASAGGKLGIGGAGKGEISGSNGRKEGIGETGKGGIGGSAGGQSGTSAAGKGGLNESGAGKGGISGSNGGKGSIGGKGGISGSSGGKGSIGGKGGISGSSGGKLGIGGAGKGGISGSVGGKGNISGAGKKGIGGSAGGQAGIRGSGKGGKTDTFKSLPDNQKKKSCSVKNKKERKGTAGTNGGG